MKDLGRFISKVVFYAMVVVLLSWTASLSIAFVRSVLPEMEVAPYFALIVFDGGMIAWLLVFLYYASGLPQRGIALIMSVLDFIGAGVLGVAELFMGGQSYVTPSRELGVVALWVIGLWTIVNVGATIAFHLTNPDTMREIAIKNAYDKVAGSAITLMEHRMDELGGQAASKMSGELVQRTMFALGSVDVPRLEGDLLDERVPHDLNRRMCIGVTGSGKPCVRYARPGYDTCWQHAERQITPSNDKENFEL